MTTQQYQNLIPREAANAASPRLFSFARIRGNSPTRFYPGDGAKLHFGNRDVDTLEIPGVPSGFLAAGDVVTATYKGTCVFRGDVATIVESRSRGTDATQTVTCVGPWSKMQRLVYRQNWKSVQTAANVNTLGNNYSSRLILNQTLAGQAQNLNTELKEIADYGASSCGYTVESANVSVSTQVLPYDECRDITVADAIKRELKLFPKAVAYFDYSTATPAFHILGGSRSVSTAPYVASIPKTAREYVYNAHPITGVDLEIEATGTIEGVEYRQISHQKSGNTEAGNPDCLYATLQIKGPSSSTTRQSFKSITEDIPQDLNDVSWWKERHPRLANVASSAVTITEAARTGTLPRISAATAGEIEAAGLECEVSKFTCKATIETTDDKEEEIYLTLQFLTTNAEGTSQHPKTYTWTTAASGESGESVPSNLAATILAERTGHLLSERMTIRLGDTFPVLGDAIVETDGTVFLQSIDIDCGSLTADLDFGVPEYLSPEDMASLLSNFRNKCTARSEFVRKTGKTADGSEKVEMGSIPPLSSSEFAPGTKAKTKISSSAGSSGSIKLDSSELGSGEEIAVREVTVTDEDGEEKTVKVLATEDFTPGGTSGVTSLNDGKGDMSVIGGVGISVETNGRTIKITANADKEDEDADPNSQQDPCTPHPGSGSATGSEQGGGGVNGMAEVGVGGDGCNGCKESSTVGDNSDPGGVSSGSSGQQTSSTAANGKPATSGEISGTSGGKSTTTYKPGSIEATNANTKTTIYGGTHNALTNTKTMNESPFKSSEGFKSIGSTTKTPIYTGTHDALTNTKTMNESPFKSDPNFKPIGSSIQK